MANPEHVAILKQGVEVWNQWKETQRVLPDLRGANLTGIDLFRAELSLAKLGLANLINVNLKGADLEGTDLFRADLSGAYLGQANLREANLKGANLSGADLFRAELTGANLSGTNLYRVNLWGCIFGDVDLSTAKGLDTVEHRGPSTIGIDTIINSHGNIPTIFLRKAGVPQSIIEQIPLYVNIFPSPFDEGLAGVTLLDTPCRGKAFFSTRLDR